VTVQILNTLITITHGQGIQPTNKRHTSTVVVPQRFPESSLTVYAAPVNGYNIVARQAVSTGDATTPPVVIGAITPSGGVLPGVIAGAVVGGILGLGLLALGAYFIRKRYRHSAAAAAAAAEAAAAPVVDKPELAAREWKADGGGYALPPHCGQATMSEMSGVNQPQELPFGRYAHELLGGK
jgi:hypothetical protein